MRHPSGSLGAWDRLTAGKPAALEETPEARTVATALAALQGFEAATLGPSTLHLFWDVLGMLVAGKETVYMEAGAYPIARWGIERARGRGVRVRTFRHHDAAALERRLASDTTRPVIVCDGFCPACGGPAPIADYRELAVGRGGRLLIDDTQALG